MRARKAVLSSSKATIASKKLKAGGWYDGDIDGLLGPRMEVAIDLAFGVEQR